jgi:hypothetical protein
LNQEDHPETAGQQQECGSWYIRRGWRSLHKEVDAEEDYYDALHEDEYRVQDQMIDPVAFLAKRDEETMYFHQAMKAPDRDEFVKAIVNTIIKEMNDRVVSKNSELVPG